MERINPTTGVVEESTHGIFWHDKVDPDGDMTRINTGSGVVESSHFGLLWDAKEDPDGNIKRIDPDSGEVEYSHHGILWDSEPSRPAPSSGCSGGGGSSPSRSRSKGTEREGSGIDSLTEVVIGVYAFAIFAGIFRGLFTDDSVPPSKESEASKLVAPSKPKKAPTPPMPYTQSLFTWLAWFSLVGGSFLVLVSKGRLGELVHLIDFLVGTAGVLFGICYLPYSFWVSYKRKREHQKSHPCT